MNDTMIRKSKGINITRASILIFSIYYVGVLIFDLNDVYYSIAQALFIMLAACFLFIQLGMRKRMLISSLHWRLVEVLCLFFVSSILGINMSFSTIRLRTILMNIILSMIVYNLLYYSMDERYLEKIFLWGGIIYFAWTLYIYGLSEFFQMLQSGNERLGNEVSQTNVFGMNAGVFAVAYIYWLIMRKKYWYLPLIAAMILLIAASASRKAVLVLPLAFVFCLVMKNGIRRGYKSLLAVALMIPVVGILMQWDVFALAFNRLLSMLNLVKGEKVDLSTQIRQEMITYGIKWYWKRPILGYGLDCYKALAINVFGTLSYAHNNYVELLVDVGVVGFVAYYGIYAGLIVKLVRLHKHHFQRNFYLLILLIMLFNDIGSVTYVYKTTYIYWTMVAVYIARSKNKVQKELSVVKNAK